MDLVLGGHGNPGAWPESVMSICKETWAEVEVIKVHQQPHNPGEWIAIDIIGAMNFITSVVSIDEHDMWVYAMDGSYIEPQKVQALELSNGDRYSVLVKTYKAGNFKIRSHANSIPQVITGHAILVVTGPEQPNGESKPYINLIGKPLSENVVFFDQKRAAPFPPDPVPQKASALYKLDMLTDGASYLWAMNSTRLMPESLEHATPIIFQPQPYIQNNVTITTKKDTWIDLVFFAVTFPMPPHPIHKHGTKMYQIGDGFGDWKWTSVDAAMKDIPGNFNLKNPPRRDAFASPFAVNSTAWVVVRYHASIPGPWLLHCHTSNHMVGGMMMVIQDGIDYWPKVPRE